MTPPEDLEAYLNGHIFFALKPDKFYNRDEVESRIQVVNSARTTMDEANTGRKLRTSDSQIQGEVILRVVPKTRFCDFTPGMVAPLPRIGAPGCGIFVWAKQELSGIANTCKSYPTTTRY